VFVLEPVVDVADVVGFPSWSVASCLDSLDDADRPGDVTGLLQAVVEEEGLSTKDIG
jgi:hypothetical protein